MPLPPDSRPEASRPSRFRPPDSRPAAVLAPTPRTPGMLSEVSPHSARKSAILARGDAVSGGDLGRADQPGAGAHRGVQDPHPRAGGPGVAQQLVVVLVHGGDEHLPSGVGGDQGGDHVVGFGVVDLDPGDAEGVQAGLDVGQGEDRAQRVRRPRGGWLCSPGRCPCGCAEPSWPSKTTTTSGHSGSSSLMPLRSSAKNMNWVVRSRLSVSSRVPGSARACRSRRGIAGCARQRAAGEHRSFVTTPPSGRCQRHRQSGSSVTGSTQLRTPGSSVPDRRPDPALPATVRPVPRSRARGCPLSGPIRSAGRFPVA